MGVTVYAIDTYLRRIRAKHAAPGLAGLVRLARTLGLSAPDP